MWISGTPLVSTTRAASGSPLRLNAAAVGQCSACPPSQTTAIRVTIEGSSKSAAATSVIAPIAAT